MPFEHTSGVTLLALCMRQLTVAQLVCGHSPAWTVAKLWHLTMPATPHTSGNSQRPGFVSVLKQAVAQEGRHGLVETLPEDTFAGAELDDVSPPLSQTRWFQTSAKAVRMSVLAHIKRSESRTKVNKQLREWADNKVAEYTDVRIPASSR